MKLEKIEYQKLQIGSVIQAKKDGKVYYVDDLLPKITIVENGNPNNCKGLSISTLTRYYQLVVPEAVGEQPVEPEVEPEEVKENQVQDTPVTTISTTENEVKIQISSEPKSNRKKKLTNEQYIQIAENFLKGVYKTKKEVAEKYLVDPATISDMLSDKYVRKSCKEAISALKIKYGYSK